MHEDPSQDRFNLWNARARKLAATLTIWFAVGAFAVGAVAYGRDRWESKSGRPPSIPLSWP